MNELFLSVNNLQEMISMMNPSLIYDLEKYHPNTYRKVNDHKHKFMYEIIKNNLERGIEEGLYRPEIDINIIAKYRLATVFLIFNQEVFPQVKYQAGNVLNAITDNFLYGITTAKGQKLIIKYKNKSNKK